MEKTSVQSFIHQDMTIGEIVLRYPEAIETLLAAGLHCVGCGAQFDETLSQGAHGHGMPTEKIAELVGQVNKKIAQTQKDFGIANNPTKIVALSSRAADKVRSFMQKQPSAKGLRFAAVPGGCSGYSYGLTFETQQGQNDEVIEEKGIVFFIARDQLPLLKGSRIDFVDSIQGSGFKIVNPNAQSTCGCGQSFS